jgi:hypothetical protein
MAGHRAGPLTRACAAKETSEPVRPTHRLHRCGHVHKSVEFALKRGSYWLEVSGSESPVISLIITPEMD